MDNFGQHVPKPGATQAMNIVTPPVGVQRNRLTLYLSLSAILLSVASAAVSLFVFLKAGEAKMVAETKVAEAEARWKDRVREAETALNQERVRTERMMQLLYGAERRRSEADAKVSEFKNRINTELVEPAMPSLRRSIDCATRGDCGVITVPPSSIVPPAPRIESDPLGIIPGMNVKPNTDPYGAPKGLNK
jgi:hypothetical protein